MSVTNEITKLKKQFKDELLIVGHHYQSDAVIQHTHLRGDSLELARKAMQAKAKHIVFCGVHFMAESSALLAQDYQKVYMPNEDANCVMAQMLPALLLEKVLQKLTKNGRKVIPLAYINTSLAVKAVVGKYNGSVCTSANAKKMMEWALNNGDAVLFVPDKNLARNTAKKLGLENEVHILNITNNAENIDMQKANKTRILAYPGLCAIHSKFRAEHIQNLRKIDPKAEIIVHPECPPETVNLADMNGSTTALIEYTHNAKADAHIYIATEINLVNRLANETKKFVKPLRFSACSDMAKTSEENLLAILQNIKNNKAKAFQINLNHIAPAKQALEIMLSNS